MGPVHTFSRQSTNDINFSLNAERSFSMICDLGNADRMISQKPFALCFGNVLLLSAREFMFISDLRGLRACVECMTFASKWVNLRWTAYTLDNNQNSNRLHFPRNCSKFWWVRYGMNMIMWQSRTSRDFVLNIRTQWSGLHSETRFQKESNKRMILKSAWFRSFGPSTEFTVREMCPKVLHIILRSFVIPLCLILLKVSAHISGERSWKAWWYTGTMHLLTMRGNQLNVSGNVLLVEFRIWVMTYISN
jgi:hypothetical protein